MPKYEDLRNQAFNALQKYMDSIDESRAKKLAFWINDYAKLLKQEETFDPKKTISYKRGSVVKVHLGYRIGSEEGGLHYAIVMDNNNSISSPVVTVIPLTSVKEHTDLNHLPPSRLYLGDEIYDTVSTKLKSLIQSASSALDEVKLQMSNGSSDLDEAALNTKVNEIGAKIAILNNVQREISRMKYGSIALVGQIITVSKQRIFDPRYRNDALYGIRVSDNVLDDLDAKVNALFCRNSKKCNKIK